MGNLRSLIIDDKTWKFAIGKNSITIRSPENKSVTKPYHEVLGWTPEVTDKFREFKVLKITPRNIKDHILGKNTPCPDLNNLKCDDCSKHKLDTRHRIDPYAQEIHQKEVHCLLYDDCYNRSGGQI